MPDNKPTVTNTTLKGWMEITEGVILILCALFLLWLVYVI